MPRWVVRDGEQEIAIIEASELARTVTVQVPTSLPVAFTPEQADQFKNHLGLAVGVARGATGATDG